VIFLICAAERFQLVMNQKAAKDNAFWNWLGPSYWQIESQLSFVRKERVDETLTWARNMPEFQTWANCAIPAADQSPLWIRGTLGFGKSIMVGYFIEILKCLYPKAIVAYFFCRKNEPGLSKARDIIRTLAYQLAQGHPDAKKALEALRSENLPIQDDVGVGFLFDKLIGDLLSRIKKEEVFIVLDGLDEADGKSRDQTQRPARPEIEILLEHLGHVKSARLLLVSRKEANVSNFIPDVTVRSLDQDANKEDIDRYVREYLHKHDSLKRHFDVLAIDPIDYFHEHAKGIFLWVTIVLHQLRQTKLSNKFKNCLNDFIDASGDMDKLYSGVLSRFEGSEYGIWMKEILKWLIVAERKLDVPTLREAVEWSLKDTKLEDTFLESEFLSFLEVEGGSLFHILPNDHDVDLVHETLKSFLVNADRDPPIFYVDNVAVHCHVARMCLDVMSQDIQSREGHGSFYRYAMRYWSNHLRKAEKFPEDLLPWIFRFFHTSCKSWVSGFLFDPLGLQFPDFEEPYLRAVWNHLEKWNQSMESAGDQRSPIDTEILRWRHQILEQPWRLGEYLGKSAAEVWLDQENSRSWEACSNGFYLALKYYRRRYDHESNNFDCLAHIVEDNFGVILKWLGDGERKINSRSLAIGHYCLRRWRDAVVYIEKGDFDTQGDSRYVVDAYTRSGDYDRAITVMRKFVDQAHRPPLVHVMALILVARCLKEDVDQTSKIFGSYGPVFAPWKDLILGEICASKLDHRREIDVYEAATKEGSKSINNWWAWQYLADAYLSSGDPAGAIGAYKRAERKRPLAIKGLQNAQPSESMLSGMYPSPAVTPG
jgi:tetratricopeptide (TPR) repeat protein